MSLQIYKPFGPSVMKVKIPEKILNDLNDYVDKIIEDKETPLKHCSVLFFVC